jgi:hypothetical protein
LSKPQRAANQRSNAPKIIGIGNKLIEAFKTQLKILWDIKIPHN